MKATGIVRRIDDLGRVVIPKEIRRTMRIREGDPLEIYTSASGEVIFKKYSPIGELSLFATQYAEALSDSTRLSVVICDNEHVIAAAGVSKREALDKAVGEELLKLMENRKTFIADGTRAVVGFEGLNKTLCAAVPIIAAGDVSGAVVLLQNEGANEASETDIKLATVAANFLARQLE